MLQFKQWVYFYFLYHYKCLVKHLICMLCSIIDFLLMCCRLKTQSSISCMLEWQSLNKATYCWKLWQLFGINMLFSHAVRRRMVRELFWERGCKKKLWASYLDIFGWLTLNLMRDGRSLVHRSASQNVPLSENQATALPIRSYKISAVTRLPAAQFWSFPPASAPWAPSRNSCWCW